MSNNRQSFSLNNAYKIHPKSTTSAPTVSLEKKIPSSVFIVPQYATKTMMLTLHPLKFYHFRKIYVIVSKGSVKPPERAKESTSIGSLVDYHAIPLNSAGKELRKYFFPIIEPSLQSSFNFTSMTPCTHASTKKIPKTDNSVKKPNRRKTKFQ